MSAHAHSKTRILVVAGETSGDIHTARLINQMKKLGQFEFFGIGGDLMAKEGVDLLFHVNDMSFMGFFEVIKHLPFIKKVFTSILQSVKERNPDIVILTDYPGFNLRLAKAVKKLNIPVIYFISPQVWAWGKRRIKKIVKNIDKMLVILPFEEDLYRQKNLDTEFVGHPLKDAYEGNFNKKDFLTSIDLDPAKPVLALLPGSRKQEVSKLLEPMLQSYNILKQTHPELQAVVAGAPHVPRDLYPEQPGKSIKIIFNQTNAIINACDAVVVASGTATLECAIALKPMVVVYKLSTISYLIGKAVIKLDKIALVNIVAGKKIVPELIQNEATPRNIAEQAGKMLFDSERILTVKNELQNVSSLLGSEGASKRAAGSIIRFIENRINRQ